MEKLALAGMKFTQAYACSVCSPTRVSLMTGLNAARHRVTSWTLRKNASNDRKHPRLEFPKWNVNGLSPVAGIERTVHAAMVEGMDKSLGDIMSNIQRHGLTEDTIVLFISDNGGLSASGRGGKANTHNKPLSSGKGSAHEGGVRVPMLVSWPGVTDPGSTCEQPVMIEDFFTTILEMANIPNVEQVGGKIDGKSFAPLLRGQHDASRAERPLFWHFPNNWGPSGPGIGPSSAMRKGDWKLIHYYDSGNYELFDLSKDLSETNNLADSHPQVRAKLAAELGSYLTSVKAQMPIRKESGAAVAYPGE